MPTVTLSESPSIPGASPVPIHYREFGEGPPLVYLHGGWGYEAYPFDRQIEVFQDSHRILIPDRTGYGKSLKIADFPVDFHRRAAEETRLFLDALEIEKAVLWGHSDGSVIAAMMAIEWPDRVSGVILEAFHYYRVKPGSQDFFNSMVINPHLLGDKISGVLIADHGGEHWQQVIKNNGLGWQKIATTSSHPLEDLYQGKLSRLAVPTLFLHGALDPRTEPGEMDAVRRELPQALFHMIDEGRHSPHSEIVAGPETVSAAAAFLNQIRSS